MYGMSRPLLSREDRADVFRGMAHPLRRRVLRQLSQREASVTELLTRLKVSSPALSQHLAILRETGLVTQRRVGRRRVYRLVDSSIDSALKWIANMR